MDSNCPVSTVQTDSGGVIVWECFFRHTPGLLIPIKHHLNATAYLGIVAEHVHPKLPDYNCCFLPDNAPYRKAQVSSNWFLKYNNNRSVSSHSHQISLIKTESNRACSGCERESCSMTVLSWEICTIYLDGMFSIP